MAEEYWRSSPFGENSIFHPERDDKEKDAIQNYEAAKIIDLFVNRDIPTRFLPFLPKSSPNSPYAQITVMVNVIVEGFIDKVEVTVDDNYKRTANKISGTKKYQTLCTINIPKTLVRLDQYGTKEFVFSANVTDLFLKKITDTRSVKVKVDTKGDVKQSSPLSDDKNIRKPITEFKPSLNLFNFLKELEDIKNVTYNDKGEIIKFMPYGSVEGGAKTIGWGHKIKKGESFSFGITKQQAEELLIKDVQTEGVDKLVNFTGNKKITVTLNQNEFDAVVSAIFGNGYGETLAAAINKGADFYSKNPETIYKGFLTRRYAGKTELDGLIKRRAREADIFVKNQWHSYGPSDEKFKNDKQYIDTFKKFLKTGVLPILLFLSFLLNGCTRDCDCTKKNNWNSEIIKHNSNIVTDETKFSDSLQAALNRVELTYDGIGSYVDMRNIYEKEKKQWLQEIELVRLKLANKILKEQPDLYPAFALYNESSDKLLDTQRDFTTNYIESKYRSGVSIFPVMVYYRNEYKQRLCQYYFLYELE